MEYITEELDIDWNAEPEAMQALEEEVRANYGMSALEYVNMRNSLVRQHNNMLPYETLQEELLNKIIIDLTGRGLLEISPNFANGLSLRPSTKGIMAVNQAIADGDLCPHEDDALFALYYLRNKNLLRG
jgi:hypothetical protein